MARIALRMLRKYKLTLLSSKWLHYGEYSGELKKDSCDTSQINVTNSQRNFKTTSSLNHQYGKCYHKYHSTSRLRECIDLSPSHFSNLVPRVSHLTVPSSLAPGGGKMRDTGNEVVMRYNHHPRIFTV